MFILLAILAIAVLIIVHEGGHFLVARWCGMRVDRFSIGFGPSLVKFTRGETTYQISLIPLGGFVQIAGLNPDEQGGLADDPRSYLQRPVYQRLLTIFAGPGTNYLFAALLMAGVYAVFGVPAPGKMPMVGELYADRPAARAGLQIGDEVISVDSKTVKDLGELAPVIDASQGRPVTIEILRTGEHQTFTITPEKIDGHFRIGIGIYPRRVFAKVPVGQAIVAGLTFPLEATPVILHEIGQMVRGKQKTDQLSGPLGIVKQIKGELKRSAGDGLWIIASLSVALGLFNLLPLPALDGGRLIFLFGEAITRRRVNQRIEQTIHTVGMLALLCLLVYITVFNDMGLRRLFQR